MEQALLIPEEDFALAQRAQSQSVPPPAPAACTGPPRATSAQEQVTAALVTVLPQGIDFLG